MKKKILVVILLTFLLILSGCNVTDQASKDEASSEEKKVEKIEKLLEDFEDATTYDEKLKLFERLVDRYDDVDFEDADNEDIYEDAYSDMSDALAEYDEIVSALENTLTAIDTDYYGVEEFFTVSDLIADKKSDEVAASLIESFFDENKDYLIDAFTEYVYEDIHNSAYVLGYEYFKTSYDGTTFTYLFDDLFESELYASILETVNVNGQVKFDAYIAAGDQIKAQLDPLKTYEYTTVDEDGAYNAYLFGYANAMYALFYDDTYFASEYLFEIGIDAESPVTSDQVQDVSLIIDGVEYPTDGLFNYEVYSSDYFEIYTKFSTDGNNTISIDLFKALVYNTGNMIIHLTLTDGTTEDIVADTEVYYGEDVDIMKGIYTAMEAVYMLNQDY